MNDSKQEVFDFHFIMDSVMKAELMGLELYKKVGNFSGLIVEILLSLLPRIEGEHFFGDERKSCYEVVNEDMEVMRESVHVYMPGDLYRRFKLMHQDLNVYSMAQLVRLFLGWFLDFVRLHGDNFKYEFDNLMRKFKKGNKIKNISNIKLRQLFQFINKKSSINQLLSIYNKHFSPLIIYRL